MPRISLTAFEAEWLHTVICTCHDIAEDSIQHLPVTPPAGLEKNSWDGWEKIVAKVAKDLK